jgi:multiple sugar transport system permease protein
MTAALRQDAIKHAFLWPAFVVVLLISIFPLIYALTVSFQTVRLVPPIPPRFVGLDNYATILTSGRFWGSMWTTSVITVLSVVFQYVLGFALALALHHNVPGSSLYRVTFLLPMFLAPVGVALIARMIFHPYLGR